MNAQEVHRKVSEMTKCLANFIIKINQNVSP